MWGLDTIRDRDFALITTALSAPHKNPIGLSFGSLGFLLTNRYVAILAWLRDLMCRHKQMDDQPEVTGFAQVIAA